MWLSIKRACRAAIELNHSYRVRNEPVSDQHILWTDASLTFPVGLGQFKMACHVLAYEVSWSNAVANRNLSHLHPIPNNILQIKFWLGMAFLSIQWTVHQLFFLPYSREEQGRFSLPAQTTAMFQGGEKQEGLAKCKSLWNPWPDISHLFHTDNFRLEVLSMNC